MLLIPYLRDLCLKSRSWRFSHIFSSRSFVVFVFAFMSTIHFESVFAHGLRWRFTFICVCTFSCPSIICWNDHRFPLNQLYWATDFITPGGWSTAGLSVVWPNKYISSLFTLIWVLHYPLKPEAIWLKQMLPGGGTRKIKWMPAL